MKKLLLSSVAMAGASALATGALAVPIQSFDEDGTPVLTAGMSAQFEAGVAMVDDKVENPAKRDGGFVNGRFGEIYFNGEMTADNGLVYGAKIHFATTDYHWVRADYKDTICVETEGTGDDAKCVKSETVSSGNATKSNNSNFPGREYIYLKGDWGSLELGNWPGPDSTLNFTPSPTTYKGIGGMDFAYHSYVQRPAGAIANSQSPHWWDVGPKVSYITPSVSGFQAGISYTPQNRGGFDSAPSPTDRANTNYQDKIGLAARWSGDFGGTTMGISVVGGTSDDSTKPDGTVAGQGMGYYDVSGRIGFSGFVFAGSYWDFGDSGAGPGVEQDYTGWALNASYSFGPYGVELQYAQAEQNLPAGKDASMASMNEFAGWAFALGYSVAPGLKWYGEVVGNNNELKNVAKGAPDGEYKSTVFLSGLMLNF